MSSDKHVWHPFSVLPNTIENLNIVDAKGLYVIDKNGNKYADLISSWWVVLHGHSHPFIAAAIKKQVDSLCHIMFADFTHDPAINLAKMLCDILGGGLEHVFFADNGATSVEIAMKMAYQYHVNLGEKRKKFVSFIGSYHGETFGAMSAGASSGFFDLFNDLLIKTDFLPYPETYIEDGEIDKKEFEYLKIIDKYFAENADEIIAFIFEPLVQGSVGMRMCRPQFLNEVMKIARKNNVIIIFDEVMTGFGRTGKMFAMHHLNDSPDIICMSKGLSGGVLPIGATVCNDKIYNAFVSQDPAKIFMHGHSYMGNPICCSASIASLELFTKENTLDHIKKLETIHLEGMKMLCKKFDFIEKPRVIGDIAAVTLKLNAGYGSDINKKIKQLGREQGLILRPSGNVLYLMPPYCITEKELFEAYQKIIIIIEK